MTRLQQRAEKGLADRPQQSSRTLRQCLDSRGTEKALALPDSLLLARRTLELPTLKWHVPHRFPIPASPAESTQLPMLARARSAPVLSRSEESTSSDSDSGLSGASQHSDVRHLPWRLLKKFYDRAARHELSLMRAAPEADAAVHLALGKDTGHPFWNLSPYQAAQLGELPGLGAYKRVELFGAPLPREREFQVHSTRVPTRHRQKRTQEVAVQGHSESKRTFCFMVQRVLNLPAQELPKTEARAFGEPGEREHKEFRELKVKPKESSTDLAAKCISLWMEGRPKQVHSRAKCATPELATPVPEPSQPSDSEVESSGTELPDPAELPAELPAKLPAELPAEAEAKESQSQPILLSVVPVNFVAGSSCAAPRRIRRSTPRRVQRAKVHDTTRSPVQLMPMAVPVHPLKPGAERKKRPPKPVYVERPAEPTVAAGRVMAMTLR